MGIKTMRHARIDELVDLYPKIQECNFTEVSPEMVLARCLAGEYRCCLYKDYMGIYKAYGDMAFIVGAWAKNGLADSLKKFVPFLKSLGFKTMRTSANFPEEAYQRLTNTVKLWTVYERVL